MAEMILSDDPGNLTAAKYFDGTDASTAMQSDGMVDVPTPKTMLPAEEGAMGATGPVSGAQHMPNAAQPGSMG